MTEPNFRAPCAELASHLQARVTKEDETVPVPGYYSQSQQLIDRAHALLAQPEPQGETDEELLETAAEAVGYEHVPSDEICLLLARAVLQRFRGRPAIEPVPVSERLPEPGIKVLAHYFNSHGKSRTVCARWIPAKFETADSDTYDDDFLEYDEESDTFYWPEAWYEEIENWDDYGSVKINEGEVTHWQPLPHWALPVPQNNA
jgi:hypothetical protein